MKSKTWKKSILEKLKETNEKKKTEPLLSGNWKTKVIYAFQFNSEKKQYMYRKDTTGATNRINNHT